MTRPRQDRSRSGVSLAALLLVGGPVALIASFVLAFASDACGLGGHGTWSCSPQMQMVVFLLPVAGLGAGLVCNVVALVAASRGRRVAVWLAAAWFVPITALVLAFVLASTMGTLDH